MRAMLLAAPLAAVLLAGCSDDTAALPATTTSTEATTTTVAPPTSSTSTTTTVPPSSAVVRIGPARYDLMATCAAPGAGDVQVVMSGTDVNGLPVAGYVQAFFGEPYVGMQVGEGDDALLFESRLEGLLEFELVDDVLTFDEVDFVTELDLETGEFTPAGLGSLAVTCRSYVRELPPSPIG